MNTGGREQQHDERDEPGDRRERPVALGLSTTRLGERLDIGQSDASDRPRPRLHASVRANAMGSRTRTASWPARPTSGRLGRYIADCSDGRGSCQPKSLTMPDDLVPLLVVAEVLTSPSTMRMRCPIAFRPPKTWRANDWFTIITRPVSKSSGTKSRPATTEVPKAPKKSPATCTSVLVRSPVAEAPAIVSTSIPYLNWSSTGSRSANATRSTPGSAPSRRLELGDSLTRAPGECRRIGHVIFAVDAHVCGKVSFRTDAFRALVEAVGLVDATGGERE